VFEIDDAGIAIKNLAPPGTPILKEMGEIYFHSDSTGPQELLSSRGRDGGKQKDQEGVQKQAYDRFQIVMDEAHKLKLPLPLFTKEGRILQPLPPTPSLLNRGLGGPGCFFYVGVKQLVVSPV